MSHQHRKELISSLEAERESRVLAYVTSDRPPAAGQIGEDAIRPIFDQLRLIGHPRKLDLFVYSRGGAIEVPWRIASALREHCEEWDILVPFRANSAATLLALGADQIVVGEHGELGPIDPIVSLQRMNQSIPGQDTINVEDVMAYLRFAREEAGLSDQEALAGSLKLLADRLDAVALGSVYRTRTHIRDVARRMLGSQKIPPSERVMETIVETLAERVYAHGHAISFGEAKELGLDVVRPSPTAGEYMWQLLESYEGAMKIREPLDPMATIINADLYTEEAVLAILESTDALSEFRATVEVRARRQMPPNLNVTLNVGLQLPPGVDMGQLPAAVQLLFQQAQQQLAQQAQEAIRQALVVQAPLTGAELAFRAGKWTQIDEPSTS